MLFRPVFYSYTNKATHFKELAKTTSFSFFLKGQKDHEYRFTEHYENPGSSLSNWSWGNTSLRWSDLTTAWGGAELTRPASAALTHKISQWGLSHHRAGPKSTDQEPPGIPQRFWPQQKQNRKKGIIFSIYTTLPERVFFRRNMLGAINTSQGYRCQPQSWKRFFLDTQLLLNTCMHQGQNRKLFRS